MQLEVSLDIETGNDAIQGDPINSVLAILGDIITAVSNTTRPAQLEEWSFDKRIMDANGNTIGTFHIVLEED